MSITKRWFKFVLIATAFLSASVSAHVHLANTIPAAQSTVATSPETLSLTFSGAVKVIKLTLSDSAGKQVEFGFKPVVQAAETVSWELPKLAPDDYNVEWTVMGNDGHKIEGLYSFTVETSHQHHAGH